MQFAAMHKEDVKAALRKRYPSINEFERAHDLPRHSVSDLLRGKMSRRVAEAVENEITRDSSVELSDASDDSETQAAAHRLITGGR